MLSSVSIGRAVLVQPTGGHSFTSHTRTCHRFNGHFPRQPGLAGCPLDSQSPVILILSILTGQAETLRTHMVLRAIPHPIISTSIPRGFEAEVSEAG